MGEFTDRWKHTKRNRRNERDRAVPAVRRMKFAVPDFVKSENERLSVVGTVELYYAEQELPIT
jgi:hypothetical protein